MVSNKTYQVSMTGGWSDREVNTQIDKDFCTMKCLKWQKSYILTKLQSLF